MTQKNLKQLCKTTLRRRHRRKRGLEDLYLVPHTNWCGKGNRVLEGSGPNQQLGGYQLADKCCRDHDLHCPHYIAGYSEAYSMYNSRPFSAMHCSCDDRYFTPKITVPSISLSLLCYKSGWLLRNEKASSIFLVCLSQFRYASDWMDGSPRSVWAPT